MSRIYGSRVVYIDRVTKRLVDIDDNALRAAQARLGTATIKDTVNRALHEASGEHRALARRRLDALAEADLASRDAAWRSPS
jgi:Arc/MetJ family transcription regulator